MQPPDPLNDAPHRLLWAHLQHAAASREMQMPTFDGTLLLLPLPERCFEEHTAPLMGDLVTHGCIQAWGDLHPTENSLPNGHLTGRRRCCVLVTQHQMLALLQKQG